MPNGRLIVNCGGSTNNEADGLCENNSTLNTLCKAFLGQVGTFTYVIVEISDNFTFLSNKVHNAARCDWYGVRWTTYQIDLILSFVSLSLTIKRLTGKLENDAKKWRWKLSCLLGTFARFDYVGCCSPWSIELKRYAMDLLFPIIIFSNVRFGSLPIFSAYLIVYIYCAMLLGFGSIWWMLMWFRIDLEAFTWQ